jgi:CheY-like chemotaxis protein
MGCHTILLVEDEPSIRELVADVLREQGYDVVEAQDGMEAIRALNEQCLHANPFCLIVLGMILPRMDGLGVLGHLTALRLYLPVVAMSASPGLLAAAVAAGARAVLYKPFDLNELLGAVSGCCSPSPGRSTGRATAALSNCA